ncbi:hypothetical protein D3871_00350 [Noviherbaspirillum saxi]|uniref:Uncharacterized protein n=2 Tax=Noviherbaspirillum saxi TaxID=2320863 RepID=A0A3A3FPM6_9BURK|nr:hypothetical protein D3871_00350 [Noviherbaspirillum saxi]
MSQYSLEKAAAAVFEASAQQQRETKATLDALKDAAAKFETKAGALPREIFAQVDRALPDAAHKAAGQIASNWTEANLHAERAAEVYKNAVRWAPWRIGGMAVLSTFCGVLGIVIAAKFVQPNEDVVAALRREEADLRAKIQQLSTKGGYSTVVGCYDSNNRNRLCVLVDESAKIPVKGYRVIKGY